MTISNPAKILRAYMRCSGVTDTKQLAADLDIPLRTIQRLKLECAISGADATCANDAIYGVSDDAKDANRAIYGASDDANDAISGVSLARAYKESPSEINITNKVVDSPFIPRDPEKPASATIEKQPKRTAKRGTRLEQDWRLPEGWRTWAKTNFPASTDSLIDDQAAQFHDYWIAKPGAQACKLDWEATWRNWCRKGLSAAGSVRQPQHTGAYAPHWREERLARAKYALALARGEITA